MLDFNIGDEVDLVDDLKIFLTKNNENNLGNLYFYSPLKIIGIDDGDEHIRFHLVDKNKCSNYCFLVKNYKGISNAYLAGDSCFFNPFKKVGASVVQVNGCRHLNKRRASYKIGDDYMYCPDCGEEV